MAFSERVSRLKSSLIREILAAAQRPEVMSFAGGLPAEAMLPKVDWTDMPASMGQYGMSEGEPALREVLAAGAGPGGQAVYRQGHRNHARSADLPGGVANLSIVRR